MGGRQEVEKFWRELSKLYLTDSLLKLITEKGLEGCFEYWARSLNEEAADFTITLDEKKEEFTIEMHRCPSKGMLLSLKHMEPYHAYCDHCEALYKPIMQKTGYNYTSVVDGDSARCSILITKKKSIDEDE